MIIEIDAVDSFLYPFCDNKSLNSYKKTTLTVRALNKNVIFKGGTKPQKKYKKTILTVRALVFSVFFESFSMFTVSKSICLPFVM